MAKKKGKALTKVTPTAAMKSFSAEEKKLFADLQEHYNEGMQRDLWWWWEMGQKVAKAYKHNLQNREEVYGKGWMARLSVALFGQSKQLSLWRACRIADAWPTKKAFQAEIVRFFGEGKYMLRRTHVYHLSTIRDPDERTQMTKRCLAGGWSADTLSREISNLHGAPRKAVNGCAVPKTTKRALSQICDQATRFSTMFENAWVSDDFDLAESVGEIATPQLGDELLVQVNDSQEVVNGMIQSANALLRELDQTEEAIRERIPRSQDEIEAEAKKQARAAKKKTPKKKAAPKKTPKKKTTKKKAKR